MSKNEISTLSHKVVVKNSTQPEPSCKDTQSLKNLRKTRSDLPIIQLKATSSR